MARRIVDIKIDPQLLELVMQHLRDEEFTAYGIHTVLNTILAANDIEPVRPQMMYNYARNGMIVRGEKIAGVTLRNFTKSEVAEFIIRYCVRNQIVIRFSKNVEAPQQNRKSCGTFEEANFISQDEIAKIDLSSLIK